MKNHYKQLRITIINLMEKDVVRTSGLDYGNDIFGDDNWSKEEALI